MLALIFDTKPMTKRSLPETTLTHAQAAVALPTTSADAASPHDRYVFLAGRPPISEFLSFIRTMTVQGHECDAGDMMQRWRTAAAHWRELELSQAGLADDQQVLAMPQAMQAVADQLTADPGFQRAYAGIPTRLGCVDLDRLVVFQKFINCTFAQTLQAGIGDPSDGKALAELAYGINRPLPQVQVRQAGQHRYQLTSVSNDLRILDSVVLRPDQVQGLALGGRPCQILALAIGFGTNHLNIIDINGRHVLNNGSHRAYAMRAMGVRYAPAVIQTIESDDELEYVGSGDLLESPERYLEAERPPMLRDYFDPLLAEVFEVPSKRLMIEASWEGTSTEVS